MALTFSKQAAVPHIERSALQVVKSRITLDASYSGGGWAVAASDFGLKNLLDLQVPGITPGGYALSWNRSTGKLMAFEEADGGTAMQEIDGTELDGVVIDVTAWGYGQ